MNTKTDVKASYVIFILLYKHDLEYKYIKNKNKIKTKTNINNE